MNVYNLVLKKEKKMGLFFFSALLQVIGPHSPKRNSILKPTHACLF